MDGSRLAFGPQVCAYRGGGAGSSGWLGCLAELLRATHGHASEDVDRFVCQVGSLGYSALHDVLRDRRDAVSDEQQLAAVVALLCYGGDATTKNIVSSRTRARADRGSPKEN